MPLHRALALLLLSSAAFAAPAPDGGARFTAALAGHWKGALEYKDYRPPHKLVTLPTLLDVEPQGAGLALRFTYDDGPGKTVRSGELFSFDSGAKSLRWGDEKQAESARPLFTVRVLAQDQDGTLHLVAETEGRDDDKPATLRETFTVRGSELQLLKETRPPGGAFGFRHRYLFHR